MDASGLALVLTAMGAFVAIVGAVCVRIITAQASKIHTVVEDVSKKTDAIAEHVNGASTAMQNELKALREEVARNVKSAAEFKEIASLLAQANASKEKS